MQNRPDDNTRYLAEQALNLINSKIKDAETEIENKKRYIENLEKDAKRLEAILAI